MSENRNSEQTKQLERANVDSRFITSKENVFYFSNYYTDPHERLVAVYISQQHDPLLILPTMELEDAKSAGWKKDIIHYGDHENPWEKLDRKSTRLNSSHVAISYAVFCLKKKN